MEGEIQSGPSRRSDAERSRTTSSKDGRREPRLVDARRRTIDLKTFEDVVDASLRIEGMTGAAVDIRPVLVRIAEREPEVISTREVTDYIIARADNDVWGAINESETEVERRRAEDRRRGIPPPPPPRAHTHSKNSEVKDEQGTGIEGAKDNTFQEMTKMHWSMMEMFQNNMQQQMGLLREQIAASPQRRKQEDYPENEQDSFIEQDNGRNNKKKGDDTELWLKTTTASIKKCDSNKLNGQIALRIDEINRFFEDTRRVLRSGISSGPQLFGMMRDEADPSYNTWLTGDRAIFEANYFDELEDATATATQKLKPKEINFFNRVVVLMKDALPINVVRPVEKMRFRSTFVEAVALCFQLRARYDIQNRDETNAMRDLIRDPKIGKTGLLRAIEYFEENLEAVLNLWEINRERQDVDDDGNVVELVASATCAPLFDVRTAYTDGAVKFMHAAVELADKVTSSRILKAAEDCEILSFAPEHFKAKQFIKRLKVLTRDIVVKKDEDKNPNGGKNECREFKWKGRCSRGDKCPFKHGTGREQRAHTTKREDEEDDDDGTFVPQEVDRDGADVEEEHNAHMSRFNRNGKGKGGGKGRGECFNCGEDGHKSFECPHKDKGPKCFKCNEFGHLSRDCPNAKKGKGSTALRTVEDEL